MPSTPAPALEAETAWTVCVSPTDLRLLQACVKWLLEAQHDPAIRQQLADVRSQLERARPMESLARPPRLTAPR